MKVTTAMLADAAVVQGGKLYIHGGGWDALWVETLPATQPAMAFAWIFQVEYGEALKEIRFVVDLVDEDDTPAGPRLEAALNAGHPPGSRPGAPVFIPLQWTLNLIEFAHAGGYRVRLSVGDRELASVPFRVIQRTSTES
jgi:hypothetical protein